MLTRIVCHGVPTSLATMNVHATSHSMSDWVACDISASVVEDDARRIVVRSIVPARSRVINLDHFALN